MRDPQAPQAVHRGLQEADSRPGGLRKAPRGGDARVRPRQVDARPLDQAGPCMRLNRRRGQPRPRAEPPHRARARERQAQDGGRRLKTSGAGIRAKVTVIAANAGRYPISARCRILGVPRSTCYRMLAGPPAPPAPDPIEPDAPGAFGASRGGYGARRPKVALARSGITASGRRICRILRQNGLSGAYSGRGPRPSRPAAPPGAASAPGRGFDGHRESPPVSVDTRTSVSA